MKLSEWLRGPVPKNDPVICLLNWIALAFLGFLCAVSARATVPSSSTWVQYTTTTLPQTMTVPFVFQNGSDLLVLDSKSSPPVVLTQNSDYSVSGGNGSIGTISTISGGAHGVQSGDVITISRRVPLTQTTTFSNGGPLTASMIGQAFDKLTEISQQLNLVGGNSLQFPGDEQLSGILPKTARAGNLLGFAANGTIQFYPLSALIFPTVAPMQASSIAALKAVVTVGLPNGYQIPVSGYYAPNDGGGGTYVWNSTSTAADNGGTIIQATGITTGRWLLQYSDVINVRWFGAKGDHATDDTAAIQAAINAVGTNLAGGYIVYLPPGVYLTTSTLTVGARRITIRGAGPQGSNATAILKLGANASSDYINAATNIVDTFSLEHIQLQGDGTVGAGNGVTLGNGSTFVADCRITNCWFNQLPNACLNMVNVGGYHINNCGFEQSVYGIYIPTGTISSKGNNVIENNRFFGLTTGIFVGFSQHDTIVANHFDNCGAANDISGAIVLSTNADEIRGTSIAANNFRANYNDVLCTGAADRANHLGVTVNSVIGNHSDFAQRHFFYSAATDGMAIIGNYINDPGQQTTNTFAAIDLESSTANCTVMSNVVQYAAGVTPAYGLKLGSGTSATVIGENQFAAQSGAINFAGGSFTYLTSGIEGTFTPTVYGASTAGTTTYTKQIGTYQRNGQWVHFALRVAWSAASGTGTMRIGGLPFNAINTTNLLQAVTVGYAAVGSGDTTSLNAYIPFAGDFVVVNKYAAGTSTALDVEATGDLVLQGSYRL